MKDTYFACDESQNVEQEQIMNLMVCFRKAANAVAAACVPLDLAEATAAHDERLEMELLHRVAHLLSRVTPVHLDHHAQLLDRSCTKRYQYHHLDAAICIVEQHACKRRDTPPLSAGPRR